MPHLDHASRLARVIVVAFLVAGCATQVRAGTVERAAPVIEIPDADRGLDGTARAAFRVVATAIADDEDPPFLCRTMGAAANPAGDDELVLD